MKKKKVSIVIPVYNEEASLPHLHKSICSVLKKGGIAAELVFIDDGSTDKSADVISKLKRKDRRVRLIGLRGNWGKTVALKAGFQASSGEVILTMDADLQDDPIEIPKFLRKIDEGYDLVSGWKVKRKDPVSKTIPSKIGNLLARKLTGIDIHDLNCGFKAYRREVVDNLNLYGELYKYIPILAHKQNFKVAEIPVRHVSRKYGASKYGVSRNIKGILDLLTVVFLTDYLGKPSHFFGSLGIISFFFGFVIGLYISYLRITTGSIQYRNPLLFLGMLLMIIGVQLVTTGLLAEMITNLFQRNNDSKLPIQKIS